MKVAKTARISLVTLGLLAGCNSNQDRSNTNSQDNPSLQGGTAAAAAGAALPVGESISVGGLSFVVAAAVDSHGGSR